MCIPHILKTIKNHPRNKVIPQLIKIESEKIEMPISELKEFQRKHDYRFVDEGFGQERDSWIRAIEKMNEKKGVIT